MIDYLFQCTVALFVRINSLYEVLRDLPLCDPKGIFSTVQKIVYVVVSPRTAAVRFCTSIIVEGKFNDF
jgi:hypothetical protein